MAVKKLDTIYRPKFLAIYESDIVPSDLIYAGKNTNRALLPAGVVSSAYIEIPSRKIDLRGNHEG